MRLWSEDLAVAGYDPRFSGKWHIGALESPKSAGRREHFVTSGPGAHHGSDIGSRSRPGGSDRAQRAAGRAMRGRSCGPVPGLPAVWRDAGDANRHDEEAVAHGLEALAEVGSHREPWCLFVGAIVPHDPYIVPGRYLDLYDPDDVPLPPAIANDLAGRPAIYSRMRDQIFGQLTEREVREGVRHFWAYCSYLDDLFGQLLAALAWSGQVEETLVLYVADHGDYCADHGLFAKGIPCFAGPITCRR